LPDAGGPRMTICGTAREEMEKICEKNTTVYQSTFTNHHRFLFWGDQLSMQEGPLVCQQAAEKVTSAIESTQWYVSIITSFGR
jgi:hypothetical protein